MCDVIKLPKLNMKIEVTPQAGISVFDLDVRFGRPIAFYVSSTVAARVSMWKLKPSSTKLIEVAKDVGVVRIEVGFHFDRLIVEGPSAPVTVWFEQDVPRLCDAP